MAGPRSSTALNRPVSRRVPKESRAATDKFEEFKAPVRSALIDKALPKNCSKVSIAKTDNQHELDQQMFENIMNLGGRVEIMKAKNDQDQVINRRNFKVFFEGDAPSVGYER
jgi:hypothetical protein